MHPSEIIAEIAGKPASRIRSVPDKPLCPFSGSTCQKKAKRKSLPVCSVYVGSTPVAVCPKRLLQAPILEDVIKLCWKSKAPRRADCELVGEVKMEGFGNVDFTAISRKSDGSIHEFVSVEVQAIDTTGSYYPAFQALKNRKDLKVKPTYGLNYDNVYKRYVTQLIRKGYYHHHWGTRIVGVMQDVVFDDIRSRYQFLTTKNLADPAVNIIFLVYKLSKDPRTGGWCLKKTNAVGTSHANLQQAVMYASPPLRNDFLKSIERAAYRP